MSKFKAHRGKKVWYLFGFIPIWMVTDSFTYGNSDNCNDLENDLTRNVK